MLGSYRLIKKVQMQGRGFHLQRKCIPRKLSRGALFHQPFLLSILLAAVKVYHAFAGYVAVVIAVKKRIIKGLISVT